MQSPSSDAQARRSSRTLWLVLAICAAPVIASYIAYYVWRPSDTLNYGTLIEPRALSQTFVLPDGRPFSTSEMKGRWVLVAADAAACEAQCRQKLVYMRQVRLAQGKHSERIERLWLVTDNGVPDPALLAEHPGLVVARAAPAELARALPAPVSPAQHIYVVDPLGHLMMRFPPDPDPRRMLKDVSRLLRHSQWK